MNEVCVFAGTTEGRRLTELLCAQGIPVYGCVATEYGGALLEERENLTISARRMEEGEMEKLMGSRRFSYVVDATHPYAPIVTENIRTACEKTNTPYLRLLREGDSIPGDALFARTTAEAVELLKALPGNILLTTGSKELAAYAALPDFGDRVYARVLPMESSLMSCRDSGLMPSHIFAIQGPFSLEMNLAMLKSVKAQILVTKDSGPTGGFPEKAEAARLAGARLLVIGRPPQVEGMSFDEMAQFLSEELGFSLQRENAIAGIGPGDREYRAASAEKAIREVTIVGIGPGNRENRTAAAEKVIVQAECLIGAKRMLEAAALPGQKRVEAIAPEAIRKALEENAACRRFAVVMSGDVGFFSGTKKLLPLLEGYQVHLIPGLSSLVALCARLGTGYEDVTCLSLHGRQGDIVEALRRNDRVFVLVGGKDGVKNLCIQLVQGNLGMARVSVGERLGYDDEKITTGTAEELAEGSFDSLSAVLVEYDMGAVVTHGLSDDLFLRGTHGDGSPVPMTKREIRAAALSLLELSRKSICWDIGAGTGSVSVEMALQADRGQVWAVERKDDALPLLEENRKRFHVSNLQIVPGAAPQALQDLPAPTHVFIGGSSGNLREILETVFWKNPRARVVASAIALETVAELTACQTELPLTETQVLCLSAARGRKAGAYHLMTGQNPVYLFLFQG